MMTWLVQIPYILALVVFLHSIRAWRKMYFNLEEVYFKALDDNAELIKENRAYARLLPGINPLDSQSPTRGEQRT